MAIALNIAPPSFLFVIVIDQLILSERQAALFNFSPNMIMHIKYSYYFRFPYRLDDAPERLLPGSWRAMDDPSIYEDLYVHQDRESAAGMAPSLIMDFSSFRMRKAAKVLIPAISRALR
jgi:hypothetical protein